MDLAGVGGVDKPGEMDQLAFWSSAVPHPSKKCPTASALQLQFIL